MCYRTVDAANRQVAVAVDCKFPGRLLLGRWVKPTVGTLLLWSWAVTCRSPIPCHRQHRRIEAPLAFASTQLSLGSYATFTPSPTVAPEVAKPLSTIDLFVAAFGSVLALTWAMIGAWLGARREPAQKPINKLARDGTETTALTAGSAHAALRGHTYEGMRCYDGVASTAVGDGDATRIG